MSTDHSPLARLVLELRRRRVFRTAALYVIGAWLVLQVADVLFPGFGIPEAAIRVLVWTAILGFPVAVLFGWFFDIGRDGIRRTLPADAAGSERAPALTRSDYAVLAAFLVVAGVLVYNAAQKVRETPAETNVAGALASSVQPLPKLDNSIAVLPFDNWSSDPDNEFFCDGVSDEILNRLSGFRELNVIGRTSSFAFKGSNYGVERISAALGVHFVLQGSVRRQGEQLRISAQLLDENGRQVWSQSFDRALRNVFEIQTEIADAVATTIVAHIVPSRGPPETPDIQAYEYYLTGRERLHRRDWDKAEAFLRRAVEADPDFAAAHAELAISLLIGIRPRENFEIARQHIERALALKPGLARARAAQGFLLLQQREPDYAGAERILRSVLDEEPNMSDALLWLTGPLSQHGRAEEAFELLKRAYRVDPLHASIAGSLAKELLDRGERDAAIRVAEQQIEQPNPGYTAFAALRDIYGFTGRLVDMNRAVKSMALRVDGPQYFSLALSYAVLGRWSAADYWLRRSMREYPRYWAVPFYPSILPQFQGRSEEAVRIFREVMSEADFQLAREDRFFSFWFGALLARAGEYSAAIDLLAPLVSSGDPMGLAVASWNYSQDAVHALAWSYLRSGAADEARPLLEGVERQCSDQAAAGQLHGSDALYYCAENSLMQGDVRQALVRFEQAVEAGWREYYLSEHDPYWQSLHDNPDFRKLMTQVKADVDRQRAEIERLDAEEDFVARLDAVRAARAAGETQAAAGAPK